MVPMVPAQQPASPPLSRNRATLVSRNLKDFRQVPGLQVENCAD